MEGPGSHKAEKNVDRWMIECEAVGTSTKVSMDGGLFEEITRSALVIT